MTVFERTVSLFRANSFFSGIGCIAACCLLWWSFGYHKPLIFADIDSRFIDAMFRFRGKQATTGQVVIVDIDEKSLKKYGQWPWPRNLLAKLTENITRSDARVIGFDILFPERDKTSPVHVFRRYRSLLSRCSEFAEILGAIENGPQYDYDKSFGAAIADTDSVMGYVFLFNRDGEKEAAGVPFPTISVSIEGDATFPEISLIDGCRTILNIPELSFGRSEGFINVFPDTSGTVRKVPLFIKMDNVPYPSLPFEMYRLANGLEEVKFHASGISPANAKSLAGVSLGGRLVRTDDKGQMTINFRGGYRSFPYLSASDILARSSIPSLREKYVLIGASAAGLMDFVATPFTASMPGVEVHANVIDNLLANDAMYWENFTEIGLTYAVIIVAGLLITLALSLLPPLSGFLAGILIIGAVNVANYSLLFLKNQLLGMSYISMSLFTIFLVVTFANYLFEGRRKQYIRRVFSHYVSPSVISEMLKFPGKLDLYDEQKDVTVLFCDIRNFTRLSEDRPAREIGTFLNEYFSLMTDVIIRHKGMVDKFIGDAVMAVWGTPVADKDHATNAMKAALEMQRILENSKNGRSAVKLQFTGQPIQIGIGINSGLVSAGNFGSDKRFAYTVLGDNVNLASRIESLTKFYQMPTLVSGETRRLVTDTCRWLFVDTVLVKGRKTPVSLYTPLTGEDTEFTDRELVDLYEKALRHYRDGKFTEALPIFAELRNRTGLQLYDIYRERCRQYQAEPPEGWAGIFSFH